MPVVFHTINQFFNAFPDIQVVLVLPEAEIQRWESLDKTELLGQVQITPGGESRFHSVQCGLALVEPTVGLVGVHDAVRPCVSIDTIKRAYDKATIAGSGVPVVPVASSIRKLTANGSEVVDREDYRIVQTPQCFSLKMLNEAYANTLSSNHTDDASVYQAAGHKVYLVDGNVENIKITSPADLITAHALMNQLNN